MAEAEAPDDEQTTEPSAAASASREYVYGYDWEHNKAWRQLLPKGRKELAVALEAGASASGTDAPLARWLDGAVHPISELTNEDLEKSRAPRAGQHSSNHYWEGEHQVSYHRLVVTTSRSRAARCCRWR